MTPEAQIVGVLQRFGSRPEARAVAIRRDGDDGTSLGAKNTAGCRRSMRCRRVRVIKGKGAIHLTQAYGTSCSSTAGPRGYFVSTVGRDETVIRAYIRTQEEADKRIGNVECPEALSWPPVGWPLTSGPREGPLVRPA